MGNIAKEEALGDLLLHVGLIDAVALSCARATQDKEGISLTRALCTLKLADEDSIATAIATSLKLELLAAEVPEVPTDVAALLTADFCRKRSAVPLSTTGKTLRLAMTDPMDFSTIQDAEFRTGKRVVAVVATRAQIQNLVQQLYPEEIPAPLDAISASDDAGEVEIVGDTEIEVIDPAKLAKDTQMPPVVRLVNLILSGAAKAGASDIHM